MIGYDVDTNEAPIPDKWRFNHKCLTCENYEENKLKTKWSDLMKWEIADECRDCNLEKGVIHTKPTPQLVRKDAVCDGLTVNSWSAGNTTKHTVCTSDLTQECSKRLYPLNQRSYLTKDECFELAQRDEQCSATVILRVLNNTQTQSLKAIGLDSWWTECYCYYHRSCCLDCSSKRSTGYEIYSLSAPTPDPKCSSGVVAADGFGCCSASCGAGNCGTNQNAVVQVGHCCATTACGVTRSCDQYGPPCRMTTQFVNSTTTSTTTTGTTTK